MREITEESRLLSLGWRNTHYVIFICRFDNNTVLPHLFSAWTAVCWPAGPGALVEPDLTQVDLDDDVGDGIEHKLHILGVRGTSEVGVDLLGVLSFI